MKTSLLFSALFLMAWQCIAQPTREKELKTTLHQVTVFLDGAQLFEAGSVTIPAGRSMLRIKGLSPYMDEKSIQVKADGDFTILSVNHKFNFIDELKRDQTLDSLNTLHQDLERKVIREQARLAVLKEKQSLLNENKMLGGQASGATMTQLKQALDFYEISLTAIKEEEIRIDKRIADMLKQQEKITHQLKEQQDRKILPSGEIEIRVSADHQVQGKFAVTYLVSRAGWFPKYDIRVKDVNSPLTLTYKAEVFQHTGVDWKNVKLKFSNGTPNQTGLMPELQPWLMNFARHTILANNPALYGSRGPAIASVRGKVVDQSGEAIPGVNVVVKGTTIGTVTDGSGSYSITLPNPETPLVFSFVGYVTKELVPTGSEMSVQLLEDVSQLSEVVVTAYGVTGRAAGVQIRGAASYRPTTQPIITKFVENQTTVEIEVEDPYTIQSNGEKLVVELKQYDIAAEYQYYAVPKIDKDAFLMARIVSWDQYNLLEGEANLYFEDAYVGRSLLNAKALTDTLSISLGRDKNIVIGRVKVDQYTQKRFIGSNRTESRGFRIVAKNKKSQPVKLTLFDQVPVSVNHDITVKVIETSNAKRSEPTGRLTWDIILAPQEQTELMLQYEVKYPKWESVLLE